MSEPYRRPSAKSLKEPSFDPEAAEKAFTALLPRAQALPPSPFALLGVDLQKAPNAVLAVTRFTAEPEARARFALLDPRLFDPAHLDDLAPMALAVAHVHVALQSARAQATEPSLPADLVEVATEIKTRMLDLTSHQFKRNGKLAREVAAIRAGTGYKDLASDLVRLARLYDDHPATLAVDEVNYRLADAAEARMLAAEIMQLLGEAQSAAEKTWLDLASRIWTLLRNTYAEVQAAGLFLYRNEGGEEKFPSLPGNGRPIRNEPETSNGGAAKEKPAVNGAAAEEKPASDGGTVVVEEKPASDGAAAEEKPAASDGGVAEEKPAASDGDAAEEKPAASDNAAEERPASDNAAEERPASDNAVEEKPAGNGAAEEKPAGDGLAEEKPAGG